MAGVATAATVGVVPAGAAQAPTPEPAATADAGSFDVEASVDAMLAANPGSVQTGPNTVLLEPGVMWVIPTEGEVGTQGLNACPDGWLCGWMHADYEGGLMGIHQGVHVFLHDYWWNPYTNVVKYCSPLNPCGPSDQWRSVAGEITSVYNRTDLTWTPFWSERNKANFYALRDAPSPYVGAKWNDSFTKMCAC